jgi:hypothetical protein
MMKKPDFDPLQAEFRIEPHYLTSLENAVPAKIHEAFVLAATEIARNTDIAAQFLEESDILDYLTHFFKTLRYPTCISTLLDVAHRLYMAPKTKIDLQKSEVLLDTVLSHLDAIVDHNDQALVMHLCYNIAYHLMQADKLNFASMFTPERLDALLIFFAAPIKIDSARNERADFTRRSLFFQIMDFEKATGGGSLCFHSLFSTPEKCAAITIFLRDSKKHFLSNRDQVQETSERGAAFLHYCAYFLHRSEGRNSRPFSAILRAFFGY